MFTLLRYLWASPNTLFGLIPTAFIGITGGRVAVRNSVVECCGGVARLFLRNGAALAIGHVIIARDHVCLERSRVHELHHVRQYETLGPFALPVYSVIGLWLKLRGYDPYLDHPMEPDPI